MNLTEIKKLLNEYDANALKKYGQNFLINDDILLKIATSLGTNQQNVIEIGPGLGSLTRYLVKEYQHVLAYEIDPKMVEVLKHTIITNNFILKHQDFLKANIEKDLKETFNSQDIYLIANLPYYITTPILLKVLEEAKSITKIVVMMQKEVAERFLGKPKTKDYNSLSVLIQTYMNVKKLFDVSSSCFYPAPNVDSTVIMLERKKEFDVEIKDEQQFLKVNRLLFKQRRKTIVNNLKDDFDKNIILNALELMGISPLSRSEELTISQIVKLSELLKQ